MARCHEDTVAIRSERPEDREAIARVHEAAFGRPDEARLVEAIRASDRFDARLSLVAEEDGAVVGHVLLSGVDLAGPTARRPVLCLAPIGVLPERQGCGIGSALVRAALAEADARGEPLVVLTGDPAWYERFGFVPAASLGIEPPAPLPPGVLQVARLSRWDARIRGAVRYPPAFDLVS